MLRRFFAQPLPVDYPNRLRDPQPFRQSLATRWTVIFALLLACALPRAIMSFKIGSVCPDGTLYIRLAKAIEAGNYRAGTEEMSLNTYPVILMFLHRAGLEWEMAGKVWGVLMATLVVLPLWGLVRRQFDDRVAVLSCLLYAFHCRMIESSPELIRDPTFWFLFTFTLYLAWRAITEVRWWLFGLGGLAFGLSCLTRFEGLFLIIPVVLWSVHRAVALREGRWRVILGGTTILALFPAILLAANLLWLRGNPHWELFRTRPLQLVWFWFASLVGHPPDPVLGVAFGFSETITRMKLPEAVWLFLHNGEVGLTPLFALLMFGGLWAWRRMWLRRDHQPLFYVSMAICAGVWIHLWCSQSSNHRYLFPIVIMGAPFAALGLLSLAAWLGRLATRESLVRGVAAASVFLVVSGLGLADALSSHYGFRRSEPQLGQWIQKRYGARPVLLGSCGVTHVIGYYCDADCHSFPPATPDGIILASIDKFTPDVILLQVSSRNRQTDMARYRDLVERIEKQGFEVVNALLPKGCERLVVLARKEKGAHLVQRPPAGPPGPSAPASYQ